MLNDIAWPTRLLMLGFGVSVGVILSGPVVGAPGGTGFALVMAGIGVELAMLVAFPIGLGAADRRFRAAVASASAEIASGAVVPVPAIGRVVRRRLVDLPWWMPGRGSGPGRAGLTVLTVVGDGPARRAAALVPADLGLTGGGVPALVLVHPTRRDVVVLDDRVSAEQLATIDADPRWRSERLPTDRTVVGGYLALFVSLLVGGGIGVGIGSLVVALVT